MSNIPNVTWPAILAFGNLLISSAIVITAFSLLGYMLTHNLRSGVAQAFNVLMACVLVVFAGDIVVPRVEAFSAAVVWLRLEWIGITLVPAAYVHFSDAVLRTTHEFSTPRRVLVVVCYVISGVLALVAQFSDFLVYDGVLRPPVNHLQAGALFPVFVMYFAVAAAYGASNVYRARRRSLTQTSRRRMTYLTVSSAAPGLGVFPYLVVLGFSDHISATVVLFLSMVVSLTVGTMLVVMAYSVAFYGVLTPDRVVKHDLIHYLLRGPIVGSLAIVVMLVMPRVELILGLPRDTALIFAVVGLIVLGQLAVNLGKPWIERLIFRQDREEVTWIQALEMRLLTSSDLAQVLGNVLAGLCELLRVDTGFALVQTNGGLHVEAVAGQGEIARWFARDTRAQAVWDTFAGETAAHEPGRRQEIPHFFAGDGFWFCPLRSQDGAKMLGLVAVLARHPVVNLDASEKAEAGALLTQAEAAIADRYVQEGVFATLQRILPDLERIQEWRSALHFAPVSNTGEERSSAVEGSDLLAQGSMWQQWVKDALSHFWGGPKLSESPLTGLKLVGRALGQQDGNPTRALRAVLQEAIERQRPPGERKLTASEWLLYNILDLRFVQGERVRDIASRLAISESDLYRKQRIAVSEVAKTLAEMESEGSGEDEVQIAAGPSAKGIRDERLPAPRPNA